MANVPSFENADYWMKERERQEQEFNNVIRFKVPNPFAEMMKIPIPKLPPLPPLPPPEIHHWDAEIDLSDCCEVCGNKEVIMALTKHRRQCPITAVWEIVTMGRCKEHLMPEERHHMYKEVLW